MKYYRLKRSSSYAAWGRSNFFSGEYLVHYLPKMSCRSCGTSLNSIALPFAFDHLRANTEQILVNVQESTSKIFLDCLRRRGFVEPPVDATEFGFISAEIRRLLELDPNYPVLSGSRITSLIMRWRDLSMPPVYADPAEDVTLFCQAEVVEHLAQLGGVRFTPVRSETHGSSNLAAAEVSVVGFAEVCADESELASLIAATLEDWEHPERYRRCVECSRIPERAPFLGNGDLLETDDDLFRLNDFSGIYVSQTGKEALERLESGLEFALLDGAEVSW